MCVVVEEDSCKTLSPSSVCNNNIATTSAPTTTTTPSGGDVNDNSRCNALQNNAKTTGLLLNEVDV